MGETIGPSPKDLGIDSSGTVDHAAEAVQKEGEGQRLVRHADRIQSDPNRYTEADLLRQRALPSLEAAALHKMKDRLAKSVPGSGDNLEAQADLAQYEEKDFDKSVELRQKAQEAKRQEFLNRSNK